MKIMLVQPGVAFSVADVHRGWVKALRQLGHTVVDFNFDDRLAFYSQVHLRDQDTGEFGKALDAVGAATIAAKGIEIAAFEFWPDLIIVTSGFYIPEQLYELLRSRGMKVVLHHLEAPYEDAAVIKKAGLVDAVMVNDPTNLDLFRDVNPKTWYMPHAYDPDVHRPGPVVPDAASDFCFVGTGFPSRAEFFESVDWGDIDVALAGNWRALDEESPLRKYLAHDIGAGCDNVDAVDLYRSTQVSANLYRREAILPGGEGGWAMGPREVELAACGTFFLREARGEGDEILPMLPTFDSPEQFQSLLRYYLARPEECAELATRARQAVAGRLFLTNALELLRLLGL